MHEPTDAGAAQRFTLADPPPGFIDDPYPFYAQLRAHDPVHALGNDQWLLTRYDEINAFEKMLTDDGVRLVKFFLHIDRKTQLKRFEERETDPLKQYKLSREDWRNRKKWDAYEGAVCDMVDRTSTEYAPWTLVEANNKYHARIKVLRTLCRAVETALDRVGKAGGGKNGKKKKKK